MPRELTRRQVLAGAGAAGTVLLAGCSDGKITWKTDGGNESDSGDSGDGNGDDGVDVDVSADADDNSSG